MQTEHSNPKNATDTDSKSAPTTETAPFVCNYDDCVAVLPTEGARRSHEERDHDDEETEVAA